MSSQVEAYRLVQLSFCEGCCLLFCPCGSLRSFPCQVSEGSGQDSGEDTPDCRSPFGRSTPTLGRSREVQESDESKDEDGQNTNGCGLRVAADQWCVLHR